jgi:hypothetical protein
MVGGRKGETGEERGGEGRGGEGQAWMAKRAGKQKWTDLSYQKDLAPTQPEMGSLGAFEKRSDMT